MGYTKTSVIRFSKYKRAKILFLCKESGTILNKENQVDLVQIKGDVAKIRGNNYIVYGSPFKKVAINLLC